MWWRIPGLGFLANDDIVGGSIELGTHLTKQDLEKLKLSGHVVNCLGTQYCSYDLLFYIIVFIRS